MYTFEDIRGGTRAYQSAATDYTQSTQSPACPWHTGMYFGATGRNSQKSALYLFYMVYSVES